MNLSIESILNIAAPTVTALIVFGLTIFRYYLKDKKISKSLQKALEREIYHNVNEIMDLKNNAEFINAEPFFQPEDMEPVTNALKYNKPTVWAFESITKGAYISSFGENFAEIFSFYYLLIEHAILIRDKIREIEEFYRCRNAKQIDDGIFLNILNEKIISLKNLCQKIINIFESKLLIKIPFLSRDNWESFKKEKNIK